jgi:hypothetical protein
MPYRLGHWFVGFTLLVIVTGFWASYWAAAGPLPLAFHVHALGSSAWLLLLMAQSIVIHRRRNALHKQLGWASFLLFPLLILGFMMIIDISAQAYVAGTNAFSVYLGPAFGIGMAIDIAAYLTLFYLALKHRRNVKLHAGYMLATPLILFESPFSRVMDRFFPWVNIIGSDGPHSVLDSIAISDGFALIVALVLYALHRRHGTPWLVAACFIAVQAVVMWVAPFMPGLEPAFAAYATIPFGLTASAGIVAGALAGWLGWRDGGGGRPRPVRPAA